MKIPFIFLVSWWLLLPAYGQAQPQNLITNGDFENYTACPTRIGQLENAVGWHNIGITPDYFSSCSPGVVAVPKNAFGEQHPFSGSSYAGIMLFMAGKKSQIGVSRPFANFSNRFFYDYNEGMWTKLQKPIKKDRRYKLSFYVSLSA